MEGRLTAMWQSRTRDNTMSHDDRWLLRGSYMVLWMALQACPSNDSYDVFRSEALLDNDFWVEMLAHSMSSASSSSFEVSKHQRIDSVASGAPSKPTTSRLWYGILEGASDLEKMQSAAEALLELVWPEKDAWSVLIDIGCPKPFCDEDTLRLALRDLLFLEYAALTAF
jgi:hypothetical protein